MPISFKLNRNDYLQFLFSKHHVVPGTQATTFEEVINSVVGVHSARLPTPYVAFHARMKKLSPSDYRSATNLSNRLIKLRCMRKTLHTVTQELAPVVHAATLELRTSELKSHLKRCDYSLENATCVLREILEAALVAPQHHFNLLADITHRVRAGKPSVSNKNGVRIARLLLKWLWETGRICYINQASHWSREIRLYGNTSFLYPQLTLNHLKREEAILELVARHVRAFEPVSEKDIAWWSGIRITEVRKALKSLEPDLLQVDLAGVADNLIMTRRGFDEFKSFKPVGGVALWCAFLAYEDPTLKGYFETRTRYVDLVHYDKLFNQIGEVRPSIIINGRAIGVWSWNKARKTISIKTFRSLSREEQSVVSQSRRKLEDYLDEEPQYKLNLPEMDE